MPSRRSKRGAGMKRQTGESKKARRKRAIAAASTVGTIVAPGLRALGAVVAGSAAEQANNQTTDSNN